MVPDAPVASAPGSASAGEAPTTWARSHRPDRPDLDGAALAERDLLRPLDRLGLRVALDHVEAAQDFLRLGERPVRDLSLTRLEADAARVLLAAPALAVYHLLGRQKLLAEALVALHHGLHLGLLRGRRRFVVVDEQHVAHTSSF